MSTMQLQSKGILNACRTGDQVTLEDLFLELNIGPDQPKHPGHFDLNLPKDERTPTVNDMVRAAIDGGQIDLVHYLFTKFPKTSFDGEPLSWAIDIGNVQLVEAMCKLDPASANGASCHRNTLAYACEKPENADIVHVLLRAGADPNKPAEHTPPWSNTCWAVIGGMPIATFQHLFDYGYRFDDRFALRYAISRNRPDVVAFLFEKGKDLPTARFDSKEELIKLALEGDNTAMVNTINRVYPTIPKQKGLVETVAQILGIYSKPRGG